MLGLIQPAGSVATASVPEDAMVAADNLSPERAEELTVYPPHSLGEAFRRYRRTNEWTKTKAPRTREDWWRAWKSSVTPTHAR